MGGTVYMSGHVGDSLKDTVQHFQRALRSPKAAS
jgi:hypothetical protein